MSAPKPTDNIQVAAISESGLSEKRPVNEDSFLADGARGIFVVADGVGGADAGEVASQKAVEVLSEAFRDKVGAGEDVEDLMELAIQKANSSIHQIAADDPRASMMATTVVVLHLDGSRATIGHVGDSRLYRLDPDGNLLRETADHSIVEEEVRAGRMTPEQAANHPSKNVISRALGAENDVDVDMKVIEVDDGTEFLLCTDGITRHIPDHELSHLVITHADLPTLCSELRRICFQRGAEDNLTAVVVCVGQPLSAEDRVDDLERTMSPEAPQSVPSAIAAAPLQQTILGSRLDSLRSAPDFGNSLDDTLVPESTAQSISAPEPRNENPIVNRLNVPGQPPAKSGIERTMTRFFMFVLFLALVGAAFYAGRKYKGPIPYVEGVVPVAA